MLHEINSRRQDLGPLAELLWQPRRFQRNCCKSLDQLFFAGCEVAVVVEVADDELCGGVQFR